MKKLVIFYSFEGSTKLLAKAIAETIKADVLELKPKKEVVKSHGFAKYFWGGKQVFLKEKPELEKFDKNPNDYDMIFLGTPVWSFTYAPAMRSFLESQKLQDKKIALFCAFEGQKGKIFENMKKKLAGNEFISEKDFYKVSRDKDKNIVEAKKWAEATITCIASR